VEQLEFKRGSIIRDTYRLDMMVAKGGMGVVYKGTHLRLSKEIAVKLMLPQFVQSEEQRKRFLNEAVGIAKIQHRNVVSMLDVGMSEEGVPFFVMEYLQGETLRQRLKRRRLISMGEASRLMMQTLSGVSALHAKKVIHRDMKPSNIFIAREADGSEIVKILDFGVSKFHVLEGDEIQELTTTGTILGTPSYMSPEQAGGKKALIDHLSDIYSCGVILYRSVSGINPFKGDNYNETIANILNAPIPPPSFFVPEITKDVDELVLKAIDRSKASRYSSCKAFIEALKKYAMEDGLAAVDLADIIDVEEPSEELKPAEEGSGSGSGLTPSVELSGGAFGREAGRQKLPRDLSSGASIAGLDDAGARKRSAWVLPTVLIGVLIVAVAGVWGGIKLFAQGREHASEMQAADPVGNKAEDEGEAETCALTIADAPEGAVVYVDGVLHPERPVSLLKQEQAVTIRVEASGFEPWEEAVAVKTDTNLAVRMNTIPAEDEPPAEDEDATKSKTKSKPGDKKKSKTGEDGKKKRKIMTVYPGKSG
jgi:serine/threonine protein kinase